MAASYENATFETSSAIHVSVHRPSRYITSEITAAAAAAGAAAATAGAAAAAAAEAAQAAAQAAAAAAEAAAASSSSLWPSACVSYGRPGPW